MHVSHIHDAFKRCFEIGICRSYFLIFAWALNSNFKNFDFTELKIKFPIE